MPFAPVPPVAHVEPPMPTAAALPILAVGCLVLAAVAYDTYRVYWDRIAPESDNV